MRGFVTNKAGIAWIIGILILSMALFTNVDLTLAGGKKATSRLDGKGVKVVDAETGFDGLEWLKLYKSNGRETKEYAGSVAVRAGINAVQWSPELKALHQRFSEQARINELRDSRWKILKSFRNSRKVSELSMSKKSTGLDGAYAAGTTTILLNGVNPATINVGESVVVTISLLGDTAFVNVYWDANDNQIIDAGDFDIFFEEDENFIVDNGFEDEDPSVGNIKLTLSPLGFEEDDFLLLADNGFLFRADDGTAADTAALWINSVPTGFSVSGTVGGGYEDVIIFAESCIDEFCSDFGLGTQEEALATTDASGNYTLHLPTDRAGYWLVGAFDVFGVTGGLFPSPSFVILYVTGDEVGVDFNFITGDATIDVTLKDGAGTAIPNIRIFAFSDNFDIGIEETTDASGSVSFNVVGGDWFVFPDEVDLLGNYLVPFTEHIFLPPGGMTSIDMVAHTVDGTITGVTYLDDVATSGIVVRATSDLGFSKTTSAMNVTAGDYSVEVSTVADASNGYCVSACHLSRDQFVVQDYSGVQTGAANIDIYVSSAEGYIEGIVYDIDTGDPVRFAGICASVDNTDGNFNCTGTGPGGYYLLPVLNGVYTVFAFAEGFLPDEVNSVSVNNDTVRVDFFLEKGAGISFPDVRAVIDIPNDQGRQVRVIWNAASLDFTDITFYTLWRLVIDMEGVPETQLTLNQELWDYIDWVPDVRRSLYSYPAAPTLGDSISPTEIWLSTFMVIAHTDFDKVFLPGAPGVGYSVDNLIPDAPSLSGMLVSAGIELTWTEIVNEEAKYYTVYRSVNGEDFQPVENTTATVYLDTDVLVDAVYTYFVTATDYANQEGLSSNVVNLALTGIDRYNTGIPEVYALDQNYPNPFNPTTSIEYQIPNSGSVSLKIYNLRGELVSTLVDEKMTAGYHEVTWNAPNVSSGMYFYRLQAGDFVQTKKMILMK